MNSSPQLEGPSNFRQELICRTARCLADQQSAATHGERPRWDEMTPASQRGLTEGIARVLLAMDQALDEMVERGLVR